MVGQNRMRVDDDTDQCYMLVRQDNDQAERLRDDDDTVGPANAKLGQRDPLEVLISGII